jgi:hypothetical protein
VVTSATSVSVAWDGHFINSRHKNNQWLDGAAAYGGIDKTSKYDDIAGTITINSIDHEDGKKQSQQYKINKVFHFYIDDGVDLKGICRIYYRNNRL